MDPGEDREKSQYKYNPNTLYKSLKNSIKFIKQSNMKPPQEPIATRIPVNNNSGRNIKFLKLNIFILILSSACNVFCIQIITWRLSIYLEIDRPRHS